MLTSSETTSTDRPTDRPMDRQTDLPTEAHRHRKPRVTGQKHPISSLEAQAVHLAMAPHPPGVVPHTALLDSIPQLTASPLVDLAAIVTVVVAVVAVAAVVAPHVDPERELGKTASIFLDHPTLDGNVNFSAVDRMIRQKLTLASTLRNTTTFRLKLPHPTVNQSQSRSPNSQTLHWTTTSLKTSTWLVMSFPPLFRSTRFLS